MARMSGFVFQDEYLERLAKLSDQEVGRMVRALAEYHATGKEPELTGRESVAFDFIRVDIDKADKAYQAKCNNMKREQPTAIERNCAQLPADDPNKNKNINIKETTLKGSKEKRSRFSPPSVDEVRDYCRERKNTVDAQRFVDFYASKGWKVGQNPMKDWKACVRTWEQREKTHVQMPAKTVRANQYTQREYNEADLEERLGVNDIFDTGAAV